MQVFITFSILIVAGLYLCSKYLPASLKKRILAAIGQRSPSAARFFAVADGACGSGCGSCKSCETNVTPNANSKRIIPIVVRHD